MVDVASKYDPRNPPTRTRWERMKRGFWFSFMYLVHILRSGQRDS
jgi:hypothetical protein